MTLLKHQILLSILLFFPIYIFSQTGELLSDIMEEKFPEQIANSSDYYYKFLETNGNRQLIEIGIDDNSNAKWYCITDGTKANSTFYGAVENKISYYEDGEEFSFLIENAENDDRIELLRYDESQDTLTITNAIEFPILSFTDEFVKITPELFALFHQSTFPDDTLKIFEPAGNTFSEVTRLVYPSKIYGYQTFYSNDEYTYIQKDENDNLKFATFNYTTGVSTEIETIASNLSSSVSFRLKRSNENYEVILLSYSDLFHPIVYDKQNQTITVLDPIDPYSSFADVTFNVFLTGHKLLIYKTDGTFDFYKLDTNEKTVIPYPTRGAIEYNGIPLDYLVKGDSIFLMKKAPSFGWREYFYFNETEGQLEILVDGFYAGNGYGSRSGGMVYYDDKIITGFIAGFDTCGIMFLKEDLSIHQFYTFPLDGFCSFDMWMNNDKIILQSYRSVRIMEQDKDQDDFYFWNECDDLDANIHPGAEEIVGNGVDEDCDGEDLTTSVFDLKEHQFNIFPNPTTNLTRITFPIKHPILHLDILDAFGKRINTIDYLNVSAVEINFSNYTNGIYFVQLNLGDKTQVVKIVKQ